MMSDLHLYRELQERENEDIFLMRNNLPPKPNGKTPVKEIDHDAAIKRYQKDFKPVFSRRRKAVKDKNYRAQLKRSGDLKHLELPADQILDPNAGLKQVGPTLDELRERIAKNPKAFRALSKKAPRVIKVEAERKGVEWVIGQSEKRKK